LDLPLFSWPLDLITNLIIGSSCLFSNLGSSYLFLLINIWNA
jgi:hypothetical protein